ncbi:hypothetical protein COLO4_21331 [Corchorus olitorius]|uniref:Uncharacterized protein n=1 Tax=Corchorus olitorius TaxID=93759 RepID=A0A1R3IU10_9ROSI|nr:hypothetical protein COLO4_21331 [Corchorus olitorius]
MAKRRNQGIDNVDRHNFGHPPHHPYYTCPTYHSQPFYGSLINRSPLSVKYDSMIHKPSYNSLTSSPGFHGFGHNWPRPAIVNPPPPSPLAIHYPPPMNINGRFGISGPSNPSRLEEIVAPRTSFGDASSLPNYIAINKPAGSDSLQSSNPSESDQCDASGIDLSLKL